MAMSLPFDEQEIEALRRRAELEGRSMQDVARQSVAMDGVIQIVGIGGAVLPTGFFSTPMGATVRAPYWGTRSELIEVLDLARTGAIHVETERFSLDQAPEAYRRLHEGTLRGRAVVVPWD